MTVNAPDEPPTQLESPLSQLLPGLSLAHSCHTQSEFDASVAQRFSGGASVQRGAPGHQELWREGEGSDLLAIRLVAV